jgi:hypothetical protein
MWPDGELPAFGSLLSYRLVRRRRLRRSSKEISVRKDVQKWEGLLRGYERRMHGFHPELLRVVGRGFGRAPPDGKSVLAVAERGVWQRGGRHTPTG